jgi:hypothetical protein
MVLEMEDSSHACGDKEPDLEPVGAQHRQHVPVPAQRDDPGDVLGRSARAAEPNRSITVSALPPDPKN